MFEYIQGNLTDITPTYAVIDCVGVGYLINISVNTYSAISAESKTKLFIHQIIREDANLLYGFASLDERAMFRLLISISGIGANTACVMLSSMTVGDIVAAIQTENVNAIKSVKGIGLKTAQRVVIELKDKIMTLSAMPSTMASAVAINGNKDEALAALVMLGFVKAQASKVLDKLAKDDASASVEELIKRALKLL
ncbi:MAG: Holliday junction branch migration protein RuvA [Marinifilaceae bacterium]